MKTESLAYAISLAGSLIQKLEDYWFGIRFKRMDVPVIGTVRKDNGQSNDSPTILNELN